MVRNQARVNVRSVLYTEDFEPITVLELSSWAREYIEDRGSVVLQVMEPVMFRVSYEPIDQIVCRQVRIWGEKFVRYGRQTLMLFTADDENALLLKAAFLPGQRRELQDEKARSFAQGFLKALCALGEG